MTNDVSGKRVTRNARASTTQSRSDQVVDTNLTTTPITVPITQADLPSMSTNTRLKKSERITRTSERNRKSLPSTVAPEKSQVASRASSRRKDHSAEKSAPSESRDEGGDDLVETLLGEEGTLTPVDAGLLGQKLYEHISKAMKKPHTPAPESEDALAKETTPKLKIEDESSPPAAGLPTPKPADDRIRAEDLEAARDLVHFFAAPRYVPEKSEDAETLATSGDTATVTTSIEITTQDAKLIGGSPAAKVVTKVSSASISPLAEQSADPTLSESGLIPELQFTITTVASQEPEEIGGSNDHSKLEERSSRSPPVLVADDGVENETSSVDHLSTPKNPSGSINLDATGLQKQTSTDQNGLVPDINVPLTLDDMDIPKTSAMDVLLTPVTSSIVVESLTDTAFPQSDATGEFLGMGSKAASDLFMQDSMPLLSASINPLDISLSMEAEDVTMTDAPKTSPAKPKKAQTQVEEDAVDSCASCRRAVPVKSGPRSHIVATLWIQCDGCKKWYHNVCVNVSEKEVNDLDKYHCSSCVPRLGPSTYRRKSSRAHTAIDYVSLNEGSSAPFKASGDSTQHPFVDPISQMQFAPDDFPRLIPELLDVVFLEQGQGFTQPIVVPASCNPRPHSLREIHLLTNGMREDGSIDVEKVSKVEKFPALFKKDKKDATPKSRSAIRVATSDQVTVSRKATNDSDALGMIIPGDLTVRRVAELIGFEEKVEVLDVLSQSQDKKAWTFHDWVDYFENPSKDRVKNVISQEFSHTRLADVVRRPAVVEALDLAEQVWPDDMRASFPKVQLYCLMGVSGSYTDFHIDFGGSSVFYHVISGKKTFFFVAPTKQNLAKYEAWSMMQDQNSIWFPSLLSNDNGNGEEHVRRVDLQAGDTMLIPSGWIHAVLTPEDALVIGGNFLNRLSIDRQIRIADIEKSTNVHAKFRYPHFQKVMWFTALDYLHQDPLPDELFDDDDWDLLITTEEVQQQRTYISYSPYELDGIPALAEYLLRTALIVMNYITDGITQDKRKRVQNSIPKHVQDPLSTVQLFGRWMAWKRGDTVVPTWARRNWNPSEGLSALTNSEKKTSGQRGRKPRGESMDLGKGGSPREGLRKSKPSAKLRDGIPGSPSMLVTPSRQVSFSSDPKGAADKIKSFAKKSGKRAVSPTSVAVTPPSTKTRKISSGSTQSTPVAPQKRQSSASETPGPGRPRSGSGVRKTPASQQGTKKSSGQVFASDGKPLSQAVINKGLADNHRLAETIRNKYAFSSSPKNSILGPKRTACDDCRRQKIACKHKDEVALAEAEIMKELVTGTGTKSGNLLDAASKSSQGSPKSQPTTSGSGKEMSRGVNYQISKNGRPVACEACKRSRRRCVHNGQEDFPPAKKRSQKDKGTPDMDGVSDSKPREKKKAGSSGATESIDDYESDAVLSDDLSTLSSLDSAALHEDDSGPLDQSILDAGSSPKLGVGLDKGFLESSSPLGSKKEFLDMGFTPTNASNAGSFGGSGNEGVLANNDDGTSGKSEASQTGSKRRMPEEFAGFSNAVGDDDADANIFAATAATAAAANTTGPTLSPTKRAKIDTSLFSPPEDGVYGEYFGTGDDVEVDGKKRKEGADKEWENNDLPTMFITPTGIPPGA